jgi:transcription antitermination factor NusG
MTWYILRVAPQAELRTEAALRDLGYQSFTPIEYKRRRLRKSSSRMWAYPMFIRYSFVGIEDRSPQVCYGHLHRIKSLIGAEVGGVVQGVLGWREKPAPLKPEDAEYLQTLSGQTIRYVGSINPHRAIQPPTVGGSARIIDGAFQDSDRQVKVSAITNRKASVLLEVFNSMQTVTIPIEYLEAV